MDLASWRRASNHLGLRCCVLDTKFGPRYNQNPLFSPELCRTSPLEIVFTGMIFTSRTTHVVLFQSYLRQCFHRLLASSCPRAVDSGPLLSLPKWIVVVGRVENPDTGGTASHGLGLGSIVCFWISMQYANSCF